MKKKSFFYGINAKMALTIVALSGALLTGCYKDDGLDVNGPTGSVTLPAAVYTLTGSVLDTDGNLVKDATVTVAGEAVSATTGSFTTAVKPGAVTIKVVPANAKYNTVEKTVTVLAVAAGQSVVYTETIVLTKQAVTPKVEAKYNLNVLAFAASNLETPLKSTEFKVTVKDAANAAVTDLASVKAGIYNIVVTPTDATKYNTYTTMLSLPVVEVEAATPPAVNKAIPFTLYSVLTEKSNPIEYNVLSAFVSIETGVEVTKMQITKGGEVVATTTEGNYIVYLAQKNSGAYKLTVDYTADGVAKQEVRNFTDKELAFAIILRVNQTSIELEEGTTPLDANTTLTIDEGTTATLNGKEYTGSLTLVRNINSAENSYLREYSAKPDGLILSKPIHILFKDQFGGQLNSLKLLYLNEENHNWIEDGGDVTTANGIHSMNVEHFSTFKAAVSFEENYSSLIKEDSTETVVGKKNDTDKTVTKKFEYSYRDGIGMSDVEEVVHNAGFKDAAAYCVKELIHQSIGMDRAPGINTIKGITDISVLPYTCLESIVKKQSTIFNMFKFTIENKEMIVTIEIPASATFIPNTYTFGHGHGHSHGHGHGDDLNAGGGIIEAE